MFKWNFREWKGLMFKHTYNSYDQGYKHKEMNIFYEWWAIHSLNFFLLVLPGISNYLEVLVS